MQWPKLRRSPVKPGSPLEKRLRRLAEKLDELPAKDEVRIRLAQELERQQREAAIGLHENCKSLVETLNGMLQHMSVQLSPEVLDPAQLDTPGGILFQINANGRLVQIALSPPEQKATTEHFSLPYILQGRMRWFNQDLLDKDQVEEHHLYFCVEKNGSGAWRYFDPRNRKSGLADSEYLAEAMENLL